MKFAGTVMKHRSEDLEYIPKTQRCLSFSLHCLQDECSVSMYCITPVNANHEPYSRQNLRSIPSLINVLVLISAWAIAAIYHALNGSEFHVHAGSLAFSVTMFLIGSTLCIFILQYRRFSYIKGELGGPLKMKIFSALIFICIWILYLLFSTLEAYCIISGF